MTKRELIEALEAMDMNDDAECLISWSAREYAGWIVVTNADGSDDSIPLDTMLERTREKKS